MKFFSNILSSIGKGLHTFGAKSPAAFKLTLYVSVNILIWMSVGEFLFSVHNGFMIYWLITLYLIFGASSALKRLDHEKVCGGGFSANHMLYIMYYQWTWAFVKVSK